MGRIAGGGREVEGEWVVGGESYWGREWRGRVRDILGEEGEGRRGVVGGR